MSDDLLDEWTIEPRTETAAFRVREVWRYRRMARFFARRAVERLYRRTILGRAWLLIRPLFPLVVKALIFGVLLSVPADGIPYFLFLVVGTASWELFVSCATWATRSLEFNRGLLTRVYVPRLILPVATMAPAFITFGIHLAVIAAAYGWYAVRGTPAPFGGVGQLRWVVLGTLLAWLMALGLGLITSVAAASARDVRFTLAYVLEFWGFLTPVLYSTSAMPERWRWLFQLNPMTSVVEMFKYGMFGVGTVEPRGIASTLVTVVVLLSVGIWYFTRAESQAVDRI